MCGIVYIKRKDGRPAYKSVLKRYRKQSGRGQEGFGYVAIKDDKVVSYKRTTTEKEIVDLMVKEDAPEILFHHRFPTSTPNLEESAHPILVENQKLTHQYFVAHNGVIRNHDDLHKEHVAMGLKYTTEIISGFLSISTGKYYRGNIIKYNDSESLAIEIALALDGQKNKISTEGSAAVIGIQTIGDKVTNRFFFRNSGNPLSYQEDATMVSISSLGHGADVEEGKNVFRLKSEGGFEPILGSLEPPLAWKIPTYTQTPSRFWNNKTNSFEDLKPALPPKREHMGFVPPYPDEDELDYLKFTLGSDKQNSMRSLEEILRDIDKIQHNIPFSKIMRTEDLWSEWYRIDDLKSDLSKEIERLDNLVDDGMVESADAFIEKERMETKMTKLQAYADDLDKELQRREAFAS